MIVRLIGGNDPVTEPLPIFVYPVDVVDVALLTEKTFPDHLHIVVELFFVAVHLLQIGIYRVALFGQNGVFQLVFHFGEIEVRVANTLPDGERMLIQFGGAACHIIQSVQGICPGNDHKRDDYGVAPQQPGPDLEFSEHYLSPFPCSFKCICQSAISSWTIIFRSPSSFFPSRTTVRSLVTPCRYSSRTPLRVGRESCNS